jgi:putative heme-binding domain-containing protein
MFKSGQFSINPLVTLMLRREGRLARVLVGLLICSGLSVPWLGAAPPRSRTVVVAWAAGLLETRIALDAPIDQSLANEFLRAAIRLNTEFRNIEEWQSTKKSLDSRPAGVLRITGVRLADGGRTVVLATDPHPRAGVYTLGPLDASHWRGDVAAGRATVDGGSFSIHYDLAGASATWDDGSEQATPQWSGWLPSFDLDESRRLTQGSVGHAELFARLDKPGRITLSALLIPPVGRVTLECVSNVPVELTSAGESAASSNDAPARLVIESTGEPTDLAAVATIGRSERLARLYAKVGKEGSAKGRRLAGADTGVVWALLGSPARRDAGPPPFALTGGDRTRGEALFFGERAKCAQCHRRDGRGGTVGPDLNGIAGRRLDEVYQALADPSSSIAPDYQAYTVVLEGGHVLSGVARAEGPDSVKVTDTEGKSTTIARTGIEEIRPSATSIMPVGLVGVIGEQGVRDLLAFLTSPAAK